MRTNKKKKKSSESNSARARAYTSDVSNEEIANEHGNMKRNVVAIDEVA